MRSPATAMRQSGVAVSEASWREKMRMAMRDGDGGGGGDSAGK